MNRIETVNTYSIPLHQTDFNQIAEYLKISEVANFALVSKNGVDVAFRALEERSRKLGFEGDDNLVVGCLKAAFLFTRAVFKQQDVEKLIPELKKMDRNQIFKIFASDAIYSLPLENITFDWLLNFWKLSDDLESINKQIGEMALCGAAKHSCMRVMQVLLELGADPNDGKMNENRPIHFAVYAGSVEAVKLLLDCGADVDAKGCADATALKIAQSAQNEEMMELLIERGAS